MSTVGGFLKDWPKHFQRLPSSINCFILALALIPSAAAWGALGKLGAMGDSLTDEYWDSGVSTYATNWTPLVVMFRGVDMGPTAAQAGTNSWGSPRGAGYKYNWALSGANSTTLLSEGQHTGLARHPGGNSDRCDSSLIPA